MRVVGRKVWYSVPSEPSFDGSLTLQTDAEIIDGPTVLAAVTTRIKNDFSYRAESTFDEQAHLLWLCGLRGDPGVEAVKLIIAPIQGEIDKLHRQTEAIALEVWSTKNPTYLAYERCDWELMHMKSPNQAKSGDERVALLIRHDQLTTQLDKLEDALRAQVEAKATPIRKKIAEL